MSARLTGGQGLLCALLLGLPAGAPAQEGGERAALALERLTAPAVRDVFKYYAAYKLQLESRAETEAARETLERRLD